MDARGSRGAVDPPRPLCRIQPALRPRHDVRTEDRRQCRRDPVVAATRSEVALSMAKLPRAILIDMDDTILSAYGKPDIAWLAVVNEFAAELGPLAPDLVASAI